MFNKLENIKLLFQTKQVELQYEKVVNDQKLSAKFLFQK